MLTNIYKQQPLQLLILLRDSAFLRGSMNRFQILFAYLQGKDIDTLRFNWCKGDNPTVQEKQKNYLFSKKEHVFCFITYMFDVYENNQKTKIYMKMKHFMLRLENRVLILYVNWA